MVLAEANLLVVANRDESPSHLPCRAWPEMALEADGPFGMS